MGPPLFLPGKECYLFTDSPPPPRPSVLVTSPAGQTIISGHLCMLSTSWQSLDAAQARGLKLGWVSWRLPRQPEFGAIEFSEGNS